MEENITKLLDFLVNKELVLCENGCYFVDKDKKLPDEYHYQSLALCVIDAVFSIGIKYTIVQNVVKNYCRAKETSPFECTDTICDFIAFCERKNNIDFKVLADTLGSHNRTSAKNGILKIEACYAVAKILEEHKINTKQDFIDKMTPDIESKIKGVKGQGSGIMLAYLYMLANDDSKCKPDRHIQNFIACAGIKIPIDKIQNLFEETCKQIKHGDGNISVRLLDYIIWEYQSQHHLKPQVDSCRCQNN